MIYPSAPEFLTSRWDTGGGSSTEMIDAEDFFSLSFPSPLSLVEGKYSPLPNIYTRI